MNLYNYEHILYKLMEEIYDLATNSDARVKNISL